MATLAAALPDKNDLAFIRKVYAADKVNFEEKYHILNLPKPIPELAKEPGSAVHHHGGLGAVEQVRRCVAQQLRGPDVVALGR